MTTMKGGQIVYGVFLKLRYSQLIQVIRHVFSIFKKYSSLGSPILRKPLYRLYKSISRLGNVVTEASMDQTGPPKRPVAFGVARLRRGDGSKKAETLGLEDDTTSWMCS